MKFIDGFTNVFLDPGHTIMHPDRTITDRHFYEAVNYGRTIQILHKNYEIVINELLLHFRIVNSLIGMTNISTLSSTLLYKHILGSVIKDPYERTYRPRTVRSNLFLSVSIYHHNSQQ